MEAQPGTVERMRWPVADAAGAGPEPAGQLPLFDPRRTARPGAASTAGSSSCTCGPGTIINEVTPACPHAVPLHDQRLPGVQPRLHLLLRPADPRVPRARNRRGLRPRASWSRSTPSSGCGPSCAPRAGAATTSPWAPTPTPTSAPRASTTSPAASSRCSPRPATLSRSSPSRTLILRDLDVLAEAAPRAPTCECSLSIGTLDEEVWRGHRARAPPTRCSGSRRWPAERGRHRRAACSIAPIIPGLSDRPEQLEAVVGACVDAGATSLSRRCCCTCARACASTTCAALAETRPDLVRPPSSSCYARGAYGPTRAGAGQSARQRHRAPPRRRSSRNNRTSRRSSQAGSCPPDRRAGPSQPRCAAGSGPVTCRTCGARRAARRRRPTPGSAPRAGTRSSPGPTSAGSSRCCSPTSSGSRALPRRADPEQVKNLVDRASSRWLADVQRVRRPGRQDRRRRARRAVRRARSPTRTTPSGRCGPRCGCRRRSGLPRPSTDAPVQLRIGVNTGEVLVGALRAGGDYTAMGDVVNTASRLQTVGRSPAQVVVGPRHVRGTPARGRATSRSGSLDRPGPRRAGRRVGRARTPRCRPGTAAPARRRPLVGRDAEMGVLGTRARRRRRAAARASACSLERRRRASARAASSARSPRGAA